MSAPSSPLVVEAPRSADAIAALLRQRLADAGFDAADDELRDALVHVAARYGEILVEHLNAAPQRMRAAFDARIGGSAAPAMPAEVLLTFDPVLARPPAAAGVVVPAGTAVAAPPEPGDTDSVPFETLDDLSLVRVAPARALAVDPRRLALADAAALLSQAGGTGDLLELARPSELALQIAAPAAFTTAPLTKLTVQIDVSSPGVRPPQSRIGWGVRTPAGFVPLAVRDDSTQQLARSGSVSLAPPAQWPPHTIHGIAAPWLVCRLLPGDEPLPEGSTFVPPRIARLQLRAASQLDCVAPDAVLYGTVDLDQSKDYFPLGERPRFGDVFHVAAAPFAQPGAHVMLALRLTNPASEAGAEPAGPLPAVRREGKPRITWEISTRRGWVRLAATDGTRSLTQDGAVEFTVPDDVAPMQMGAHWATWVRARLTSGHYGAPHLIDGIVFPAAPSIAALNVSSQAEIGPFAPAHVVQAGLLDERVLGAARASSDLDAFRPIDLQGPALYVGFASAESDLKGRTLQILVDALPAPGRALWREATRADASPRWQMLGDEGWVDCPAVDGSSGMRRTGIVAVQLAQTPSRWPGCRFEAEKPLVWIRVVWPAAQRSMRLRRIAPNTVHARQSERLRDETLGSSNGRVLQVFRALRAPVVGDVVLQVREAERDPDSGEPLWVRWHEVADFCGSSSQSRHFTLDRTSGRVAFGDGKQGRIPPAGANNVRLREYHVGGGRRGNRLPGTITQLQSSIAYVEAVTNWVAARGGQDRVSAQDAAGAAGTWLRHRGRAICAADYEDLARAASRDVARAWCAGSLETAGAAPSSAGSVTLVVMPLDEQPRPQPAPDLLATVKAYLDARRPPWVELVIAGPSYAGVSVRARIECAAQTSAHETAAACRDRLQSFLHPLRGGADARGWPPGRRPRRSDLIALLAGVDGVRRVESLALRIEEPADAEPQAAIVAAAGIEVLA